MEIKPEIHMGMDAQYDKDGNLIARQIQDDKDKSNTDAKK